MHNVNESELIKQCQSGSVEAFETLIAAYQKKILSLAYRMTGNQTDAEDIAQDVFVRVYKSIGQFNGDAAFSTWLYRVATNICLDFLRKRKRQVLDKTVSIQQYNNEDEEFELPLEDDGPSPYEEAQKSEAMRVLKEAIDQLQEEHKTVIVLRDLQGLSYEEIASATQSSLGTVKSRINRARLVLRKMLEKDKELFL